MVLSFFPPDLRFLNLIPLAEASVAPPIKSLPSNCTQIGEEALIQRVCNQTINLPPSADLIAAVKQFEFDTVTQFLTFYGIPATQINHDFVYLYGRMGLRNTLRAMIEARMMDVILKKPSLRTANEQAVLTWLQQTVQQREEMMYDSALADQQNWAHNTCGYKIDQDIAKEFNINYIPCVGSVLADNAPTVSYFLAAAFKKAYVQPLTALNPTALFSATQQNSAVVQATVAEVATDGTPGGVAGEREQAEIDTGAPGAVLQPRATADQINQVSISSIPDLVSVGTNFNVVVKLLDFNFQTVSSNVAVTLSSAPAGISGTLTVNATNGTATFNNVKFGAQGAYNVTATAAGVSSSVHIVTAGTSCAGCSSSGFTIFQGVNSNLQAILGTAGAVVGAGALFATLTASIQKLRFAIFPNQKAGNTLKQRRLANKGCNNAQAQARPAPSSKNKGVLRGVQPRALKPMAGGSCSLNDEDEDVEDALDEVSAEEDLTDAVAAESGDAALVPEVGADAAAIASTEIAETGGSEAAATVAGVGVGLASTGVGLVLGAAVLLVDAAVTFTVLEANAVTEEYNQLVTLSQNAHNNLPDMAALIQDQTGAFKLQEIWAEAMWPDAPASSVIPSPGPGEPVMITQAQGQSTWNQVNSLHYKDWAGITWNTETYLQWWVQTGSAPMPAAITNYTGISTGLTFDGVTPIIRYLDWGSNRMQAARNGSNFQISKQNPLTTDVPCPADLTAGITLGDVSGCSSWVASSIQILDDNLHPITFRFAVPPSFQPATISFPQNVVAIGESIQVTGIPTPSITIDSGTLPDGISFNGTSFPGSAQFACCNTSTGGSVAVGNYPVTLRATNAAGSLTTGVTAQVTDATVPIGIANISSPPDNSMQGQFQQWVYQASGPGPYYFYTNMTFPTGISFHDNGNGIATVSGADVSNGAPVFCPNTANGGCNIWVTNDKSKIGTFNYGDCKFDFNCTIAMSRFVDFTPKPNPATLAQSTVKFHAGQPASFTLTASNNVVNVSYSAPCGLPSWATLTDNKNGTATLSGTPPLTSGAPVTSPDQIAINPALIVVNTFSLPATTYSCSTTTPNLNIDVDYSPIFTSPPFTAATVGQPLFFGLASNVQGGFITLDSPLPAGLSMQTFATGSALIFGTPSVGSGRDYTINYHVQYLPGNAFGSPILNEQAPPIVLQVNEAPRLQLPAQIFLMEGVNANFPINPTGFPNVGDMTVKHAFPLPPGVILHSASDLSSANGFGVLQGVPAPGTAGNIFPVTILATNSIGSASQQVVIAVMPAGDVNHDSKTDCNDVTAVKAALNSKRGATNFNYYADINGDGVVNVLDLAFVTAHLPAGTVCH